MFDRISIRWRLALVSAGLTFIVLCVFAAVFGQLTASQIRSDFISDTANAATRLQQRLTITPADPGAVKISPSLELYAAPNNAAIRLFWDRYTPIPGGSTPGAPQLGLPETQGTREFNGYLIETRYKFYPTEDEAAGALTFPVWIEYARPLTDIDRTSNHLKLLLAGGVFGGTLLALLGGLALARRSLRPITALTATAQEIARTRDPDRHVPTPRSDDEVAELARTFDQMLTELDASRQETEGALERQREFVADASHELRTPLTSVLANLELLAAGLEGDRGDAAAAALRSSQRMRRIVADLLLLARSDDQQPASLQPVDLAQLARQATAEAASLAADHQIELNANQAVIVKGASDELQRLVINLVENAIRHTPSQTQITVGVAAEAEQAVLTVEDNGPGIAAEQRAHVFERFVRHAGDHGGSTGLGLAIVASVTAGHSGSVVVEDAQPGARFIVRLPLLTS